jgi:hypothetical protein
MAHQLSPHTHAWVLLMIGGQEQCLTDTLLLHRVEMHKGRVPGPKSLPGTNVPSSGYLPMVLSFLSGRSQAADTLAWRSYFPFHITPHLQLLLPLIVTSRR